LRTAWHIDGLAKPSIPFCALSARTNGGGAGAASPPNGDRGERNRS